METNNVETADLVIIGGGTAGVSAAIEAAKRLKKVVLIDDVVPSAYGTHWASPLGTCAGVGCIPKKMLHEISSVIDATEDLSGIWPMNDSYQNAKSWSSAISKIMEYLRSLAWKTRMSLRTENVTFYNAHAEIKDGLIKLHSPHNLSSTSLSKYPSCISAPDVVIATGTRPSMGDYEDIANAASDRSQRKWRLLTSDDIFWTHDPPLNTLIIGGSYIAIELASIVASFGFPVTIMIRTIPLRGFDEECAEMVLMQLLTKSNVTVITGATPVKWENVESDMKVKITSSDGQSGIYDTVILAIGREVSNTNSIVTELKSMGATTSNNGRLNTDFNDQIKGCGKGWFALGDVSFRYPELQTTARIAAINFIKRLYDNDMSSCLRGHIPSCVFACVEFATVGLTEKDARQLLKDDCMVYHALGIPLNQHFRRIDDSRQTTSYVKVICDASKDQRIVGVHMVMSHASEAIQGFVLAMNLCCTLRNLQESVNIHPTNLEIMIHSLEQKRFEGFAIPMAAGC